MVIHQYHFYRDIEWYCAVYKLAVSLKQASAAVKPSGLARLEEKSIRPFLQSQS
jgi:hypothetical protein